MTKWKTMAFLICATVSVILVNQPTESQSTTADDQVSVWRIYSKEPNGDIYFYDASRVKAASSLYRIWSRIQYKRSVMGASSYQSLLEIDCAARTQRIMQNTFFLDNHWEKPAMSTNTSAKPKRPIAKGTASQRLSEILCDQ